MTQPQFQKPSPDYGLRDRLTRLELMVTGLDGTNGLRSMAHDHAARIAALELWRREAATAVLWARTLIRWGALAAVAIVATFGSDDAVLKFLRVIKAAMEAMGTL